MTEDDHLDALMRNWQAPQPVSKADSIIGLLRDSIVRGDLPPDMPLRQDRIAQRFGISKIPLREALARLEAEGFVTTRPGRGIFVAEIRRERVEDIFRLRVLLEVDLLRSAVPRMTEIALAEAAVVIEEFEIAPTQELGKINWRLHHALYRPSGRELSLQILHGLHLHADRYVQLHMGAMDTNRSSNNAHREIHAACRVRDTEAACALLAEHLNGIGRTICGYAAQQSMEGADALDR